MAQMKHTTRPHIPRVFFIPNPFRRFEVTPDEIRLKRIFSSETASPGRSSFKTEQRWFQKLYNAGTVTILENGTPTIVFNRVRDVKAFEQALKNASSGKMAADIAAAEAEANKKWYDGLFAQNFEVEIPNIPSELIDDLAATTKSGHPIINWLVKEGDHVEGGTEIAVLNFDWSKLNRINREREQYLDVTTKGSLKMPASGIIRFQSKGLRDEAILRYQPLMDVEDFESIAKLHDRTISEQLSATNVHLSPQTFYSFFARVLYAAIEVNRGLGRDKSANEQINGIIDDAIDHHLKIKVRKLGEAAQQPEPETPSGP